MKWAYIIAAILIATLYSQFGVHAAEERAPVPGYIEQRDNKLDELRTKGTASDQDLRELESLERRDSIRRDLERGGIIQPDTTGAAFYQPRYGTDANGNRARRQTGGPAKIIIAPGPRRLLSTSKSGCAFTDGHISCWREDD